MKETYLYWLLLPGLLFLAVFMVIPIVLTVSSTFVQNSSFTRKKPRVVKGFCCRDGCS